MRKRRYQCGPYYIDRLPQSPYWYVFWFNASTRQRDKRSLRTCDFEEAKAIVDDLWRKSRKLHHEKAERVTVAEIVARYAEQHIPKLAAPVEQTYHLEAVLKYCGDDAIAQFGIARQEAIAAAMTDAGAAVNTIKRRFNAVHAALRWGFKREMIDRVPPAATLEKGAERDRALSMGELRALWAVEMPDHLRTFIALAIGTQGRKGALLALTRPQCDFERGLIDLHPPGHKRTKKGNAVVPMVPFLRPYIEGKPGPIVCYAGRPVKNIRTAFDRALEQAGLDDVHPHDLRRTVATLLRGMGVPETHIEGGLGHESFSRGATGTYARYRPEYLSEWRDAVEGILNEMTGRKPVFGDATSDPSVSNPCVRLACK